MMGHTSHKRVGRLKASICMLLGASASSSCSLMYNYDSLTEHRPSDASPDRGGQDAGSDAGIDAPVSKACANLTAESFCEDFNDSRQPNGWLAQNSPGSSMQYEAAAGPDGSAAARMSVVPNPSGSKSDMQRKWATSHDFFLFAADHYFDAAAIPHSESAILLIRVDFEQSGGLATTGFSVTTSGELALAVGVAQFPLGIPMPLRRWVRLGVRVDIKTGRVTAYVDGFAYGSQALPLASVSHELFLSLGCPSAVQLADPFSLILDNARLDAL